MVSNFLIFFHDGAVISMLAGAQIERLNVPKFHSNVSNKQFLSSHLLNYSTTSSMPCLTTPTYKLGLCRVQLCSIYLYYI